MSVAVHCAGVCEQTITAETLDELVVRTQRHARDHHDIDLSRDEVLEMVDA